MSGAADVYESINPSRDTGTGTVYLLEKIINANIDSFLKTLK